MKLIRFKVTTKEGFRSLQEGFEIYFLRDFDYQLATDFNPNILTGRNGSGKSNILEALANIFYHLDCMNADYLPDGFLISEEDTNGFDNRVCAIDAFELEYFMPIPIDCMDKQIDELPDIPVNQFKAHIRIIKKEGQTPTFEWLNRNEFSNKTEPLGKKEVQEFLPKYVLGYSSGENELMSLPFFKTRFLHFDEYAEKLSKEEPYGNPPEPEGRLVFLDNQYSQAILLANLLMQDKGVLAPFNDEVELEDLKEFSLIICLDKYIDLHEDILRDKKLTPEQIANEKLHQIQLTSNLKDSLEKLKKCATCFQNQYIEQQNDENGREYLVLDYKVNQATKDAFRFHFSNNPLQLFQLFQILLELNAYTISIEDKKRIYRSKNIFINHENYPTPLEADRIIRIKNLWIKKEGVPKPLFTKELSDGEHQFLHSLGLCLLFKNENCLFLLDEPETHFNPDWKAKFISSIRQCFALEDESTMREVLITTHSPYLISDSESKYVHVFVKNPETKEVTCNWPEFQTLGASVNKITMQIFNTKITIGNYALSIMDKLNRRYEAGEDPNKLIADLESKLGDSVEKTLFINKLSI